jgi:hypothetical protein
MVSKEHTGLRYCLRTSSEEGEDSVTNLRGGRSKSM